MRKRYITGVQIEESLKKKIKQRLYSQGETFQSAIEKEIDKIVAAEVRIERPVENFLNIRERLINKYGTLKAAAESVGLNPGMLRNTLHFLETKKNYRPSKSTKSKLSELLEK